MMDAAEILAQNHDIHFHSRDFSDGCHPVMDVARFTARWQNSPRWVGLSDHNPGRFEKVLEYRRALSAFQSELSSTGGITLLAGMELDWSESAPVLQVECLSSLDYVISSYHGMQLSTASQVERYFNCVARFPDSDVVAHPDRFLGSVDPFSIPWEAIFNLLHTRRIACEYNFTTPLRPEIFKIAAECSRVNFILSSDTHDFRSLASRRIIDAWSESLGGGYELAREYLQNLLRMDYSLEQTAHLLETFSTARRLDAFQRKIYLRSRDPGKSAIHLSEEEETVFQILDRIPENALDKEFLLERLNRFDQIPPRRILSLLQVQQFKAAIEQGRCARMTGVA